MKGTDPKTPMIMFITKPLLLFVGFFSCGMTRDFSVTVQRCLFCAACTVSVCKECLLFLDPDSDFDAER